MTVKFLITMCSRNAKTGPIMVTTSPQDTCPKVCPLRNNGCYADSGPLRRIWDRLTNTEVGDSFPNGKNARILVKGLTDLIQAILRQHNALWRMNQAGDLPHTNGKIDSSVVSAIAHANAQAKARGFTYTHHAMLGSSPMAAHNRGVVEGANSMGFTINLSANNLYHADKLFDLDVGPVVTLLPSTVTETVYTPQGREIRLCPALSDEHVTCYNCGMCQWANRDFGIGFTAHGNSIKKANEVAA